MKAAPLQIRNFGGEFRCDHYAKQCGAALVAAMAKQRKIVAKAAGVHPDRVKIAFVKQDLQ